MRTSKPHNLESHPRTLVHTLETHSRTFQKAPSAKADSWKQPNVPHQGQGPSSAPTCQPDTNFTKAQNHVMKYRV